MWHDRHGHLLMTTLIAVVVAALLAPAAVSAQDEEAADHEQAAAKLTAAVLGDELMPRIHERVLGLYRDEWSGEYVVVVPSTGDVPSAADYAPFGLPVRIEALDLTPEELEVILADVVTLAEPLARGGPDTFGAWFDARLGRVVIEGSAPASAFDPLLERYPRMVEYRQTEPGDRLVEWVRTDASPSAVASEVVGAITAGGHRPIVACPIPVTSEGTDPTAAGTDPVPLATVTEAPPARPVGTWDGTWEPMSQAPISARSDAAAGYAVWAHRIYVWGGRDADGTLLRDGAVFLLDDQTWMTLPGSPLVPRERFGFDTDQRGLTVWGGVDALGQPLDDGARLELGWGKDATMSWTFLPPAPLTPGPASLSGDINTTYAVTPGAEPGDPPRFAVLDADSGELGWDEPSSPDARVHGEMPGPPVPPGIAYEIASAWFSALLLSYQPDGSAVASWFTDMWPGEWSDPERVPLPATSGCPALEVSAFAWLRSGVDGTPVGLLISDLERTHWRSIGAPPDDTPTGASLILGPRHLVVADALLAYDTVTETWLRLPPLPDGPRTGVSATWAYGQLYLWGGRATDGSVLDSGWVFTPTLPADTYRLRDGHRTGWEGCADVGYDPRLPRAVLLADRDDTALVRFRLGGQRYEATWPDGYTVRFGDGRAAVIGADGTVVARAGDRLRDIDLPWCPSGRSIAFAY